MSTTWKKPNTGLQRHLLAWWREHPGEFDTETVARALMSEGVEFVPTTRGPDAVSIVNRGCWAIIRAGHLPGLAKVRTHVYRYDPPDGRLPTAVAPAVSVPPMTAPCLDPEGLRRIGTDDGGNPLYLASNGKVYRVLYEEVTA